MKKFVNTKSVLLVAGLIGFQMINANGLAYMISPGQKQLIEDYYNRYANPKLKEDNRYKYLTPANAVKAFMGKFISLGKGFEDEFKAYHTLLPKFFEIVKAEAEKPYWFWRSNYKKSDWWKTLNQKYMKGPQLLANDFLAYIYNINDDKAKNDSGVTAVPQKGFIVYTLGRSVFKKESTSFFKKHWGKIALAGALAAGSALAWQYRGEISPVAERMRSRFRDTAQGVGGSVKDRYGDVSGAVRRGLFGLSPEEQMHSDRLDANIKEAKRKLGNLRMQDEIDQYMDRD